jgi:hypothetical protein
MIWAKASHFFPVRGVFLKVIWLMTLRFCFFSMRLRFSSLALFSALIQLVLGALVESRSMAVSDDEKGGLASFGQSNWLTHSRCQGCCYCCCSHCHSQSRIRNLNKCCRTSQSRGCRTRHPGGGRRAVRRHSVGGWIGQRDCRSRRCRAEGWVEE